MLDAAEVLIDAFAAFALGETEEALDDAAAEALGAGWFASERELNALAALGGGGAAADNALGGGGGDAAAAAALAAATPSVKRAPNVLRVRLVQARRRVLCFFDTHSSSL